MRSRGMVGVTAFILAAVATMAIFLYLHGVKHSADTGGAQVSVIVSKKDLPAGTSMDTVISQGDLTTETIGAKTEVTGAITSVVQLKGRVTSTPILAGEQIPLQARMMTISDIYDALTAQDRPYKRAVSPTVALDILHDEAGQGKLDKDLLDIFVSKRIYVPMAAR